MDKKELQKIIKDHGKWLRGEPGGIRANLRDADLGCADLRGADLRGANLDMSCLPLRCGGLKWIIDRRLFAQLAYHLCSMQIDDAECVAAQNALLKIANEMHRTDVPRLLTKKVPL